MSTGQTVTQQHDKSDRTSLIRKGVVRLAIGTLALGAILFITSGRLDWMMAWAWLGVLLVCVGINLLVLIRINPEVIEERIESKKGAKKWDRVLASIMGVVWISASPLAGLDERFGWSPQIALSLQIVALAVMVVGDLVFLWAMAVNKFFSRQVRIQEERGHHVVTTGPYRYVRHPGYVGWILMSGTPPLIVGSLWAFIPAGLAICLMVVRTALEDRMLQSELAGYKEYTQRVRYRLMPYVW